MRVSLIVNPRAGRGRAERAAGAVEAALRGAGHELTRCSIDDKIDLTGAEAAVVVGGDGTLHSQLDRLIGAGVPVYAVPMGTENLFAREFGMSPEPQRVVEAVNGLDIVRLDIGRCNGEAFAIMAGVGFDADVVHRLASVRGATITHRSYIGPIVKQVVGSRAPMLTVEVDGDLLVGARRGTLVVANLRQYGMRLDPAPRAVGTDGLLDVVFMPHTRAPLLVWWGLLARVRMLRSCAMIKSMRGKSVVVTSDEPFSVQLDGEASMAHRTRLEIGVEAGAIGVIRAMGVRQQAMGRRRRT